MGGCGGASVGREPPPTQIRRVWGDRQAPPATNKVLFEKKQFKTYLLTFFHIDQNRFFAHTPPVTAWDETLSCNENVRLQWIHLTSWL